MNTGNHFRVILISLNFNLNVSYLSLKFIIRVFFTIDKTKLNKSVLAFPARNVA